MHLLDGTYARIRGAGQNIGILKRMQSRIAFVDPNSIKIHPNREPPKQLPNGRWQYYSDVIELPEAIYNPNWAVRLGYIVQDLRTALEYLVYALAFLDSGRERRGTHFPICSTPNDFKKRVKGDWLRGVNTTHRAAIEKLQPYNGGDWLKELVGLSNPDKHMHLISIVSQHSGDFALSSEHNAQSGIRHVQVQLNFTRFIAFSDGCPVIPLLDTLKTQVTYVIKQFKPEFK